MTSAERNNKRSRGLLPVCARELKGYFTSPMGYVVIVVFLSTSALLFFSTFFLAGQAQLQGYFDLLPLFLGVFIPAVSMGTIAEERRRGTLETLLTMPVTVGDVVLGKFLAVFLFALVMLAPTVLYAVSISTVGNLDWGAAAGGYVGAVLLAAFLAGIGIFASSVSANQIVAVVVAVLISLFLGVLQSFLALVPSEAAEWFLYAGIGFHFDRFAQGVIDTRSVLYFVSGAAVFLLISVRVLTAERSATT